MCSPDEGVTFDQAYPRNRNRAVKGFRQPAFCITKYAAKKRTRKTVSLRKKASRRNRANEK